ncbi:MAG: lipoyl synthase [Peptostreptococcaceae bacterium]|nr:lipoyl synthase [Peptostreptococcaceae bacterium]
MKEGLLRKPDWLKLKITGDKNTAYVESLVSNLNLNTVCLEANCPNRMECYARRTATFMILGRNCTRNCTFCNVTREMPDPVDANEPKNVSEAVRRLKLKHAVITSVTRDDLPDEGATQFRDVLREVRKNNPEVTVELLIPDMSGREELLDIIYDERPDVLNHNVETVPALYPQVRPAANFERSLKVLDYAKKKGLPTKSGIMVGLGETQEQVIDVLRELRKVDCDMVTIGQYLQPTLKHISVKEYVHPDQFKYYEKISFELGFKKVSSGPLVRSSYHAEALE